MNCRLLIMHALAGRLRIKIPRLKGRQAGRRKVERHLRQFSGVETSPPSHHRNVLILYDSRLTEQGEIFSALKEKGI